jgi:hypothetical protein
MIDCRQGTAKGTEMQVYTHNAGRLTMTGTSKSDDCPVCKGITVQDGTSHGFVCRNCAMLLDLKLTGPVKSWLDAFDHEARVSIAAVMERAYVNAHKLERYGWQCGMHDQHVSDMTSDIFNDWSELIPTL